MLHKRNHMLDPWDLRALPPDMPHKRYSWAEAEDIITKAMKNFDPALGALTETAFRDRWIDAPPSMNKYVGKGFCVPGTDEYHPHILVNWGGADKDKKGSIEDLLTLGHEIMHAVVMHTQNTHQQGIMDEPGTIVAELTALTGEQIIFDELKKRARDENTPLKEQIALQATYLDNTMFYMSRAFTYQMAYDMHTAHPDTYTSYSEADMNRIRKISLHDAYENTVDKIDLMAQMWPASYHQFSTPFYIGDYPLASLAVHKLWDDHLKAGKKSRLAKNFMEMIAKGGTQDGPDLLKGLGIDIRKDQFLQDGIDVIRNEVAALQDLRAREKNQHGGGKKWPSARKRPDKWTAPLPFDGGTPPSQTQIM
jgi:oligoendopeptidase F